VRFRRRHLSVPVFAFVLACLCPLGAVVLVWRDVVRSPAPAVVVPATPPPPEADGLFLQRLPHRDLKGEWR